MFDAIFITGAILFGLGVGVIITVKALDRLGRLTYRDDN